MLLGIKQRAEGAISEPKGRPPSKQHERRHPLRVM